MKFEYLNAEKHESENENDGVSAASVGGIQGTIAVPVSQQQIVVITGVALTIR